MATMIAAMTTTAVFSVILSSFVSGAKADKRDAAAALLRRAQETLKSYVSADPFNPNMFPGVSPGVPGSPGPSTALGSWQADSSGYWALRPGTHDISSLLAGTPLAGTGASFTYFVTNDNCMPSVGVGSAPNYELACKMVVFTLTYPD